MPLSPEGSEPPAPCTQEALTTTRGQATTEDLESHRSCHAQAQAAPGTSWLADNELLAQKEPQHSRLLMKALCSVRRLTCWSMPTVMRPVCRWTPCGTVCWSRGCSEVTHMCTCRSLDFWLACSHCASVRKAKGGDSSLVTEPSLQPWKPACSREQINCLHTRFASQQHNCNSTHIAAGREDQQSIMPLLGPSRPSESIALNPTRE